MKAFCYFVVVISSGWLLTVGMIAFFKLERYCRDRKARKRGL